ncbi:hypothetical protein LguiA_025589 [Lonicera macranthoides]
MERIPYGSSTCFFVLHITLQFPQKKEDGVGLRTHCGLSHHIIDGRNITT